MTYPSPLPTICIVFLTSLNGMYMAIAYLDGSAWRFALALAACVMSGFAHVCMQRNAYRDGIDFVSDKLLESIEDREKADDRNP